MLAWEKQPHGRRPDRSRRVVLGALVVAPAMVLAMVFAVSLYTDTPDTAPRPTPAAQGQPVPADPAADSAADPNGSPQVAQAPAQPGNTAGNSTRSAPPVPTTQVPGVTSDDSEQGTDHDEFDQLRQSAAEAEGALHVGTLSPESATDRYSAIEGDYQNAARGLATLTSDIGSAQLHQAIMRAADAYEVWIQHLQSTPWPPEVQPYVDNYLDLATTKGRDLFKDGMDATTVQDLQGQQAIQDMFELSHAASLMRDALGLSE
jgi:hypothetical protein